MTKKCTTPRHTKKAKKKLRPMGFKPPPSIVEDQAASAMVKQASSISPKNAQKTRERTPWRTSFTTSGLSHSPSRESRGGRGSPFTAASMALPVVACIPDPSGLSGAQYRGEDAHGTPSGATTCPHVSSCPPVHLRPRGTGLSRG